MKTIDSLCNLPAGSFKKFIEEKENFLIELENERKERIKERIKAKNSENSKNSETGEQ